MYPLTTRHAACTGDYYYQFMIVILGLVGLSKAVSDVMFYTINMEAIPGLENICRWLPGLLYYMTHVIVRLVTYAFLAAYFHHYAIIILPGQVVLNFVIVRYVCK